MSTKFLEAPITTATNFSFVTTSVKYWSNEHHDANFKYLSDDQLLANTKHLVARERLLLLEVLQHLREVDARRLYLEIGYPSLWAYCTQELKYSEAAAQRRIEAMRALRELPMIAEKIESGELSISNIAKAQSTMRRAVAQAEQELKKKRFTQEAEGSNFELMLQTMATNENYIETNLSTATINTASSPIDKLELFKQLENKTQKQAEQILAAAFPQAVIMQEKVRVINGEVSELRFMARRELLEKLERVKNLMSHKNPNASWAELVEMMADFVIAKKDLATPKTNLSVPNNLGQDRGAKIRRNFKIVDTAQPPQRRLKTTVAQTGLETEPRSPINNRANKSRPYISIKIRRQVWVEAKGCCEYTDEKSARRCETRYQLEIEHKKPRAFGGDDTRENLALYCRAHNQLRARQATLM